MAYDFSQLTQQQLRELFAGASFNNPGSVNNGTASIAYGNGNLAYSPAHGDIAGASGGSNGQVSMYNRPRAAAPESWDYFEADPNNPLGGTRWDLTPNASGGVDMGAPDTWDNTANRKKWNTIRNLSLAAAGGLAGAGALGLLGTGTAAGGAAAGAAEGLAGGAAGGTGLTAGGGLGFTGAGSLGFAPSAAGSAAWGGGLGEALAGVSTGVGAAAGGAGGATGATGATGGLSSMLPGNMSMTDLAKLGIKGAGLIGAGGSSGTGSTGSTGGSMGSSTGYMDVAQQQADAQQKLLQQQVVANRPNQVAANGATSNWTQDPTTGQWTQKTSFGAADQAKYDQINGIQGGLLGQIQNQQPIDYSQAPSAGSVDRSQSPTMGQLDNSNLPSMGSYTPYSGPEASINTSGFQQVNPNSLQNGVPGMGSLQSNHYGMDPTGNSQAIQDATYKLLQPQRDEARKAREQELANQGLRPGMPGYDRAMTRMDQGDTDAQLKSLLAGQAEYGNAFNRGLNQNQNNFGQDSTVANFMNQSNAQRFGQNSEQQRLALALRGQQLGEQNSIANVMNQNRQLGMQDQQFGANFANQSNQQQFNQNLASANFGNASNQQDFSQQMQLAGLNDQQRQQWMQEQYAQQQQPYQQLGLLGGMMPANPTMPSFATAGLGSTPDMLGAYGSQQAQNLAAQNAAAANKSNNLTGWLGLGSSAIDAFF